jgi:hydroxymethylpyrimidine pyrophosphatase-like HAD family hydrolase
MSARQEMRSDRHGPLTAFAVDLDRTLLRPGARSYRAPSAVLSSVRTLGLKVVLASGREYLPLSRIARRLGNVDALVAENGAVIEAPIGTRPRAIGRTLGRRVRERLAGFSGPGAEYGEVVVSVPRRAEREVAGLLKGLAVELVPNVDRIMVLPRGVTKATGTRRAVRALRLESRHFAAIGDAENDLALLRAASLSGAVGNAEPGVRAIVDYVCRARYAAGVAEFVNGPVSRYLVPRRRGGVGRFDGRPARPGE